jgi:hypothetical protein
VIPFKNYGFRRLGRYGCNAIDLTDVFFTPRAMLRQQISKTD